MRKLLGVALFFFVAAQAAAQNLKLPRVDLGDDAVVDKALTELAKHAIAAYQEPDQDRRLNLLFRLQMVTGEYRNAISSLEKLIELRRATDASSALRLLPFEVEAKAKTTQLPFAGAFKQEFRELFSHLSDREASDAVAWFSGNLKNARTDLRAALEKQKSKDEILLSDALDLIRTYHLSKSLEAWLPLVPNLIAEEDSRRYVFDKDILIRTPDAAQISALMIRPKSAKAPQPALLVLTIYAGDDSYFTGARRAAARGYAAVVAYTRGKGHSPDTPAPYEHDGDDARAVIDWISKQPWSDGRVGMYSGSYNGFTQWAATKRLPAALKTIVPSRAANGGNGLPMENNVFLFVNYAWTFYTTNNKYLDNETYSDRNRWNSLNQKWYESGFSYRKIDALDGMPNKWFQIWLQHPSYDKYWQSMAPYQDDFSRINIPVLTLTGYYDDAQQSALWYLREHYKYNPRAEHYLVIGPYDHFTTDRARKDPELRGYKLDSAALIDTQELIFQWMDYIFRGAGKPEILKDKINYEVMGANEWKHAPSLEKMSNDTLTLFLTDVKTSDKYLLSKSRPLTSNDLEQTVDLADRKTSNNDSYPYVIIGKKPDLSSGFAFVTEPFEQPVEISGSFSGEIKAIINKKDMDIGLVLYEVMPNGELFQLSYFTGRASYAQDMSVRKLLTPGKIESIPFERTPLVSRRLSKGSRLLLTLNVNKNPFAQINYGTGKDVSDEDISDAKIPLQIKWRTDSFVRIPIWK